MVKRLMSTPGAGIFATMVALALFFQFCNPAFLSWANVATMLRAMAYSGLIAVGMALCLISGVIDLSVGSVAGLSSVVFARALHTWSVPLVPSILLGITTGALVGLINAVVILKLRVTPFIATISAMFIVRGLAYWVSNGTTIYPLPAGPNEVGMAEPLGVSWAFITLVCAGVLASIVLNHTVFGICLRAVGSDREVASWTEVDVFKVNTIAFVIIGSLAAVAGIFLSFVVNAGVPSAGVGWEFNAITACAIGGVSLSGYEGSMFGLFCGLATMQILQNGIVMIGVSPYLQVVAVGVTLLVAMVVDVRRRSYLNLEKI